MVDIRSFFCERVSEIDEYLKLVEAVEKGVQNGQPIIGNRSINISVVQQRIICSGVYLHLYNLVEATVTKCIIAIEEAASSARVWRPGDLSNNLMKEWVRSVAKTHIQMNPENRLDSAVDLCNNLVNLLPVDIQIEKNGGGNWDDEQIYDFTKRIGINLHISKDGNKAAKRKIRDDMGPLKLIKNLRNKLAHGEMSFGECGEGVTFAELNQLKDYTTTYMLEVIDNFESYIATYGYLNDHHISDLIGAAS